LNSNEQEVKL